MFSLALGELCTLMTPWSVTIDRQDSLRVAKTGKFWEAWSFDSVRVSFEVRLLAAAITFSHSSCKRKSWTARKNIGQTPQHLVGCSMHTGFFHHPPEARLLICQNCHFGSGRAKSSGNGQDLWQPQWPFLEEDGDAGGSAPRAGVKQQWWEAKREWQADETWTCN